MQIELNNIDPNPHRNMKRNPINKDQVSALVDSMTRNKVWPNVVVRKHPDVAGRFQLAYGHHRLEAMKQLGLVDAGFIVEKVDDWGMYTAMVDENESQQKVTPELIYENIEAGINYLEPIIRKCETAEEFDRAVPRGTAQSKQGYSQVRNHLLAGDGMGRGFLQKILPGEKSTRPANIQIVLDSHYEKTKADAKDAAAAAKQHSAEEKRQEAALAKTREAKAKAQAEADKLEKEAAALKAAATKLRDYGVSQTVLLSFETNKHMTEFAKAVKNQGIPKARHGGLAKMLQDRETPANSYAKEINAWWFVASGKAKTQRADAKRSAFKKKHRSKSLDEFAADYVHKLRDTLKEGNAILEYASAIENPRTRASLEKAALDVELMLNALGAALEDDNSEVDADHLKLELVK